MKSRSSSVTISSVSSSWLRRNIAHCAMSGMGGVWSRMSRIGKRSSIRIDMNSRGMTGKWNAMWHSGQSSVPRYSTASSGHWLASARSIRSA